MGQNPENLILKYGASGSSYPRDSGGPETGFFRSWKPYLLQEGFYHFLWGLESYLEFQKKLSLLAEEPVGVSLGLSCMVEVNVAGGILLLSLTSNLDIEKPNPLVEGIEILNAEEIPFLANQEDSLWSAFQNQTPTKIYAVGVSEPGWETKLRKLKSTVEDGKLSGTKSFITNGGEADSIFWVTKSDGENPVYLVRLRKEENPLVKGNQIIRESFHTDFTPLVSHLKLTLCEYPVFPSDRILDNYGKLGMELRLKELLSLVSLLIGKSKLISLENERVAKEREKLIQWREEFLSPQIGNPDGEFLLRGFPYPTEALLLALVSHWNLPSLKDLKSIDPDYQLFVWEDSFTNYLVQKKNRKST